MKRVIELFAALFLFVMLLIPILLLAFAVRLTSKGPVLHWSNRAGVENAIFMMPKFRTMVVNTPDIATHLLEKPEFYLSPIGSFLRRSSLDELPQLLSIIKGDMSFVGPRPALFNQDDLIALRTENGVDKLKPGITGWAQINGRDELSITDKVKLDIEYMERKTFWFDMKILWLTLIKVAKNEGVSH